MCLCFTLLKYNFVNVKKVQSSIPGSFLKPKLAILRYFRPEGKLLSKRAVF